jgi:hemerythrin-like domain-containing protein
LKDAKRIIDIQNATIFQNIVNEFFDLPNSHFLKEGQHNHHDPKHEKYIEKWKKLIHSIKTDENGRFVVIHPLIEGRITIAGR